MKKSVLALLLATMSYSYASPSCLTKEEARAKYPGQHLWWHTLAHCWDDQPGRVHQAPRKRLKYDDPGISGKNVLHLPAPARDANGNVAHHSGAPLVIMLPIEETPWWGGLTWWMGLQGLDINQTFMPWDYRIAGVFYPW